MRRLAYIPRSERVSIAIAFMVIVAVLVILTCTGYGGDDHVVALKDSTAYTCTQTEKGAKGRGREYYYNEGRAASQLFTFDPNTADSTQLLRLGLTPWQVRSIYRYRAKGGIYRRKIDFARLYGLTRGQYRRLEPYISIGGEYQPASDIYEEIDRELYVRDTIKYPLKIAKGQHVALNTADSTQLRRVPGIGVHFANNILYYRRRLGGFYSVEQLKEIEGFPLESLPYFVTGPVNCRKININKANMSQLRQHPYINFYIARTITEHRRLHGPISSFDDLKLYPDFKPEVIERLKPYVEF